ncbi:hypothetical protein M501DRAFT_997827 [Patellaria atrata CBS 101060]|uniref:RNA ligase/cyclic nucleotide phosphodiesterase n=1 Tax=Patellaria atrata CBS 101060 TaxID=1346257 RepID=A0A9P4S5R3_9PEZI|nr:hypothetical protein M501DRAFT_997827 [Patellaria atrata CBS 101060]
MANPFVDLSGVETGKYDNPYDALIEVSHNDPAQIQSRYSMHRSTRNAQQREKLLDPGFAGVSLDPILQKLIDPTIEPGFIDPRHCLVFWARPTQAVRKLISDIQNELLNVVPNLWIMPQDCLHMTALEITHSRTAEEIEALIEVMKPHIREIVDYTYNNRPRLIKPMIGYDAAAIALSFVPAAGEALTGYWDTEDDLYTYHHLRKDLFDLCKSKGVTVDSRYVVPSAHLTIGRFVDAEDTSKDGISDPSKMHSLVKKIEEINHWLEDEYWPKTDTTEIKIGGQWIVGNERGLTCRKGTLWYGGGGETIQQGTGFWDEAAFAEDSKGMRVEIQKAIEIDHSPSAVVPGSTRSGNMKRILVND